MFMRIISIITCGGKDGHVLGIASEFLDRFVEGNFEIPCKNRENSAVLE